MTSSSSGSTVAMPVETLQQSGDADNHRSQDRACAEPQDKIGTTATFGMDEITSRG